MPDAGTLPKELRELRDETGGLQVTELPPPISESLKGSVKALGYSSCLLHEMGKLLWVTDKKFRVTVECDPETGRFTAVREDF